MPGAVLAAGEGKGPCPPLRQTFHKGPGSLQQAGGGGGGKRLRVWEAGDCGKDSQGARRVAGEQKALTGARHGCPCSPEAGA